MGTSAKTDRTLLTLLGLVLLAGGVGALLAGFGVFGSSFQDRAVLSNGVADFIGRNGSWLWPVAAVVGVVLALLCLLWLRRQLRLTGVGDLELENGASGGSTSLTTGAVLDALRGEIEGYRGVTGSRARIVGKQDTPTLSLRIELAERADIAELRQRIETEAVAHARQVLDDPELPVVLDLVVTDKQVARVS